MLQTAILQSMFRDLQVVELAQVLAGPAVGKFFAEAGARVIKVENPAKGGDMTRHWKNEEEGEGEDSAYYWSVNTGKEVRWLDLGSPEGHAALVELIREADILVSNFSKSSLDKFRLGYPEIRAIKPDIIYGQILGFADSERVAYDLVIQAESGFLSMSGTESGELVRMPVALIDVLTAHQLIEGILVALWRRSTNGDGTYIETSLYETALKSLFNQGSNVLNSSYTPGPMGLLHPNIAPYGEVVTDQQGRRLLLAIGTDAQFLRFWHLLEGATKNPPENYLGNAGRVIHRKQLLVDIQRFISHIDAAHLYQACIEQDIPVAWIRDLREVLSGPESRQMLKFQNLKDGREARFLTGISFRIGYI